MSSQLPNQIELFNETRERSTSTTSVLSMSSESGKEPKRYDLMDLKTLLRESEQIDVSAFDRTRLFNPRKQRSCHKRAEPVSEEHRKKESSKNSREYTKRNRDEIATCQILYKDLSTVKKRFKDLLNDMSKENVQSNIMMAIHDFEKILAMFYNFEQNPKLQFQIPEPETYFAVYRENAAMALNFEHRPSSPNQHKVKLVELKEQFEKLTNDKDSLNSSKDKTNFASSKSRLNQRIVREHLKSNCWECWRDINTMRGQAEELQKHFNQLKQEVWDNILAVYYNLIKLVHKKPAHLDFQRIEDVVEYFAPFSKKFGELSIKWIPSKECEVKIEIEEDNNKVPIVDNYPMQHETSLSGFVSDNEQETDRSIQRPMSMATSRLLAPELREKFLIQDRLITTTQFTPPALPSPSFTLTLPTVPAASISTPKRSLSSPHGTVPRGFGNRSLIEDCMRMIEPKLEVEGVEKNNRNVDSNQSSSCKRNSPMSSNGMEAKKMAFANNEVDAQEPKQEVEPGTLPVYSNMSIPMVPSSQPMVPLPIPLLNPLFTAAPGEVTPFEALTPNFFRAIEQQNLMAAFLNHAFKKCQK